MPRFPALEQLALPAIFEHFVPGRLHPDGRRYLPLIVLRLENQALIGVVDRHHRIDPQMEGRRGTARLIFLLSSIERQPPGEQRCGLETGDSGPGRASTAPDIFGRVVAVPTWETDQRSGVAMLYTELLLDIGLGIVGVRTGTTLESLAVDPERQRIETGDWLAVRRSRIDILEFVTTS